MLEIELEAKDDESPFEMNAAESKPEDPLTFTQESAQKEEGSALEVTPTKDNQNRKSLEGLSP